MFFLCPISRLGYPKDKTNIKKKKKKTFHLGGNPLKTVHFKNSGIFSYAFGESSSVVSFINHTDTCDVTSGVPHIKAHTALHFIHLNEYAGKSMDVHVLAV